MVGDLGGRALTFVYYCSGHGYGHATRVSAFSSHLLSLEILPTIHIVSSAPKHVFSDSIALGARYRNADIDPVIVQPLAYRVDRRKSVEVLENFIQKKDMKVSDESQWLRSIRADCVLSDAAFLGCLAAHNAGIPSILITNFSFDSVYSYLATPLVDEQPNPDPTALHAMLSAPPTQPKEDLEPDVPVSLQELAPLVDQIHTGYRCADLLLRLPGAIPLPSFAIAPELPSPDWVDIEAKCFKSFVIDHLTQSPSSYSLLPQIPFPSGQPRKPLSREVRAAPLLVRPPHSDVYTQEGRSRLLDSIGVPSQLHIPETTKVLIVSFGGQVFHKPHSRSHSRTPSKASTPKAVPPVAANSNGSAHSTSSDSSVKTPVSPPMNLENPDAHAQALSDALRNVAVEDHAGTSAIIPRAIPPHIELPDPHTGLHREGRPRALSQLRVEGAPPAAVPTSPRAAPTSTFSPFIPTFQAVTIPPTPRVPDGFDGESAQPSLEEEEEVRILPDDSWIAIVCGVPKDWGREDGEELPERFFVAPRDVYMPDLTAVADVLLGKLGYGTVSECVDACTPFVYVPRPLFIEEHGLKLYLEQEGVGVELSRTQYEVGEWADAVERAWTRGREAKARKRQVGETGKRTKEGREMARYVVDWVERWQASQ